MHFIARVLEGWLLHLFAACITLTVEWTHARCAKNGRLTPGPMTLSPSPLCLNSSSRSLPQGSFHLLQSSHGADYSPCCRCGCNGHLARERAREICVVVLSPGSARIRCLFRGDAASIPKGNTRLSSSPLLGLCGWRIAFLSLSV